jgi:hypothetical protein
MRGVDVTTDPAARAGSRPTLPWRAQVRPTRSGPRARARTDTDAVTDTATDAVSCSSSTHTLCPRCAQYPHAAAGPRIGAKASRLERAVTCVSARVRSHRRNPWARAVTLILVETMTLTLVKGSTSRHCYCWTPPGDGLHLTILSPPGRVLRPHPPHPPWAGAAAAGGGGEGGEGRAGAGGRGAALDGPPPGAGALPQHAHGGGPPAAGGVRGRRRRRGGLGGGRRRRRVEPGGAGGGLAPGGGVRPAVGPAPQVRPAAARTG